MRKLFVFVLLLVNSYLAMAQQPDWIYQVSYRPTGEFVDSVNYYSNIYMDVNPSVLMDSSLLVLRIGTTSDASDIYYKEYRYTPAMYNDASVQLVNNLIRFNMGKYVVPDAAGYSVTLNIWPKK